MEEEKFVTLKNDFMNKLKLCLSADLQRRNLQRIQRQRGGLEDNGLCNEGRLDGPGVKQVGVVAHFTELHEDVNHRHEVAAGQRFPGSVNRTEHKPIIKNQ